MKGAVKDDKDEIVEKTKDLIETKL